MNARESRRLERERERAQCPLRPNTAERRLADVTCSRPQRTVLRAMRDVRSYRTRYFRYTRKLIYQFFSIFSSSTLFIVVSKKYYFPLERDGEWQETSRQDSARAPSTRPFFSLIRVVHAFRTIQHLCACRYAITATRDFFPP